MIFSALPHDWKKQCQKERGHKEQLTKYDTLVGSCGLVKKAYQCFCENKGVCLKKIQKWETLIAKIIPLNDFLEGT